MSGVFPQAENTDIFLDHVLKKKECIIEIPDHRWPGPVKNFLSSAFLPDNAVSGRAGLIKEFGFDPWGYAMDKDLVSLLDPVHKLVLHAGRDAFMKCFHTKEHKRRTGVILAAIALPTDASSRFSREILCQKNYSGPSPMDYYNCGMVFLPSAILSRAMGFTGVSFTLDAACASSLYAIKLACSHLHERTADIMIAGGVSRPDSLYTQIGFSQLQALSPSGRCSAFDRSADGLVVGEGVGIVVLKRLEDAIACKDTIHAVITGTGASNDIEGTLVGPASEGQLRAMAGAYKMAGWTPSDIEYMECHGSGTPVGDAVEITSIHALCDLFHCPKAEFSIGSVKSMIGHLLTAAGAAGFIKTLMSMNKGVLPPSLNFTAPPDKSELNRSRIKVQTEPEEWKPKGSYRKAAISAFGFGGINAHILLEEYKPTAKHHAIKSLPGPENESHSKPIPCAIVGMSTLLKRCNSLDNFADLIFGLKQLSPALPHNRWRRSSIQGPDPVKGYFLDEFSIDLGEFHIPPVQMDDILPQHILLLKAVKGALEDAKIRPRPHDKEPLRYHMGCCIGIEFDYGATDFHLRWTAGSLDEDLKNQLSAPLTFNRTLGALGGIVASRVAREFKLGGPSFTLSAGSASGIRAIETGIQSLNSNETDIFIAGCVDLAGDIRPFALNHIACSHSKDIMPSEGAAALILKRLDQAILDNDRIYGVIKGVSGVSGGSLFTERPLSSDGLETLSLTSLESALKNAGITIDDIGLYDPPIFNNVKPGEALGPALVPLFKNALEQGALHVSSAAQVIGHTGAVSSLFSVIASTLCLYYRRLPYRPPSPSSEETPSAWDLKSGQVSRKACIASTTPAGTCSHIILEEYETKTGGKESVSDLEEKRSLQSLIIKTSKEVISDELRQRLDETETKPHSKLIPAEPVHVPDFFGLIDPKTSDAHIKFLEFSENSLKEMEKQFQALTHLAHHIIVNPAPAASPFLDREACLEFAIGKAGHVLGNDFDIIDSYPVRVRLPDEPLMLVDRIMEIKGERLSLSSGRIVTQHDVKKEAWYLDGGKAPVCISIEAGQADLFLCSFLGIDHVVKGKRKYRLLDARVTFHRTLPQPGETIEYHIQIDRFLKQGDIYLFFFHYKGYIGNQLLISMRDGCAGFFTETEVENSGGIILKHEDVARIQTFPEIEALVPVFKTSFSEEKINALRTGDLSFAFGEVFKGKRLGINLWLPGDRMHLIDRVLEFDPKGGRFGLGSIIAEADIHPDDWFLTCHFVDDPVMPGTLMYECCAHALRIFTQRMGWVTDRDDVYYDILIGNESDLKCRGPVTPKTQKARYEIEIKKMSYDPEPFVLADAHMFSDDLRIVLYRNMGMKLRGLNKTELERFWSAT